MTISSVLPQTIRWGIISAGKISSDFTKAIAATKGATAAAVAARSANAAAQFASQHSIPKSYGSYDDLLRDPDIDVVYVGSIADSHSKLATKSILAGKPTVVEKPMTISLKETQHLVSLAKKTNTFLMEGMWTRCFPAMRKIRDIIASGAIGDIITVQGDFGWNASASPYPTDRIWNPKSGGMTLDVGMYMAQLGQVAYPNATVDQVQSMGTMRHGVDHAVLSNIMYSKSRYSGDNVMDDRNGNNDSHRKGLLQFYITGSANTEERVTVQGTHGRIVVDPPAHIPTLVRVHYDEGRGASSSSREEIYHYPLPDDTHTSWNYPQSIGFTHQIQEVGMALRNGEKECRHFTLRDSVQVASILDDILNQVRGGGCDGDVVEDSYLVNGYVREAMAIPN